MSDSIKHYNEMQLKQALARAWGLAYRLQKETNDKVESEFYKDIADSINTLESELINKPGH